LSCVEAKKKSSIPVKTTSLPQLPHHNLFPFSCFGKKSCGTVIYPLTIEPVIMIHQINRVQNSGRLPAVAGTLATLAGDFSPKK